MICKWIAKILLIKQLFLKQVKDYIICAIYDNNFMLIVPVIVV